MIHNNTLYYFYSPVQNLQTQQQAEAYSIFGWPCNIFLKQLKSCKSQSDVFLPQILDSSFTIVFCLTSSPSLCHFLDTFSACKSKLWVRLMNWNVLRRLKKYNFKLAHILKGANCSLILSSCGSTYSFPLVLMSLICNVTTTKISDKLNKLKCLSTWWNNLRRTMNENGSR